MVEARPRANGCPGHNRATHVKDTFRIILWTRVRLPAAPRKVIAKMIHSASSLRDKGNCTRSWAASRLGGYRGPETAASANGTRLHSYQERYFETGQKPPQTDKMGRLATDGLHLLPPREDVTINEHGFYFQLDGSAFRGYVDFGHSGLRGDHKTSSDPVKYGLNAETLPSDVQAMIYGATGSKHLDVKWYKKDEAGVEQPLTPPPEPVDELELRWVYYPTRSGQPFAVSVQARPDELLEQFAETWLPHAKEADFWAENVPENPDRIMLNMIPNSPSETACRWCGFKAECRLWPRVK